MRKITAKDVEYLWHDTFDDIEDYFYRNLYPNMVCINDSNGYNYILYDYLETEEELDDIIPSIKSKTTYRDLFHYLESLDFKVVKKHNWYCVTWPTYDDETKEWHWEE